MTCPPNATSPSRTQLQKLTVLLPARDEASGLKGVLTSIQGVLRAEGIPHELLVVDDHSVDGTTELAESLSRDSATIRHTRNEFPPGLGNAIEWGAQKAEGEIVAIMMADGSDSPRDLVSYYNVINSGADCAFGSRFRADSTVIRYPPFKLLLNRLGNHLVRLLFRYPYDDFTNAFKAYRTPVLRGLLPLHASGFDVTLEIPLRALRSGASFNVISISWSGRTSGRSKMRLVRSLWSYAMMLFRLRLGIHKK